MKKFILVLLAMATVGVAQAQKGTILLYGNAGLHTEKDDMGGGNEDKQFDWNINPGIGYQFTDNITVGVQGGFMSMKNTNLATTSLLGVTTEVETINKMNGYQAGVFFRYGMKISKMFTLFDQIDASYLAGKSTTDATTTVNPGGSTSIPQVINDEYNGFAARLFPGLQVHVKDGMAINFSFGGLEYRTITTDMNNNASSVTTSSFDLTLWEQFNFGVSYNIGNGNCCSRKGGSGRPGDDLRPLKVDPNQNDDDE